MPKFGLVISFHISAASAGAVISGSSRAGSRMLLSSVALLQQQRDAEPEQQLQADRQPRIEQRDPDRVPEAGSVKKSDVVVEPDEAAGARQVQPVAQDRVVDGGEERDEDADADEQRRQAQQIGQRAVARRTARAERCAMLASGREAMPDPVDASMPRPQRVPAGRASLARCSAEPGVLQLLSMLSASWSRPSSTGTSFATIFCSVAAHSVVRSKNSGCAVK